MNRKHWENIYHANVNVNVMLENVIPSKSRIAKNVDVSIKIRKNIMHAKSAISGILEHVLAKMVNI